MLISVAICTCNGEKYIGEQLESILMQSRPVDEIIICDDKSEDDTIEICRTILDKRPNIHSVIVKNKERLGPGRNFEKACSLCTGDIVFLCDQDDVWKENKVLLMSKAFHNPLVCMAYSNANYMDVRKETSNQVLDSIINYEDYIIRRGKSPNGCLMVLRNSYLKKAMPFYITDHFFHDAWLAYIMPGLGKVCYVRDDLVNYRKHNGSITQSDNNDQEYTYLMKKYTNLERRFRLDVFSQERFAIMRKIIYSISEDSNNCWYLKQIKSALKTQESLLKVSKARSRLFQILLLTKELINRSYYYIDTDSIKSTTFSRLKRYISDVLFIIKQENM